MSKSNSIKEEKSIQQKEFGTFIIERVIILTAAVFFAHTVFHTATMWFEDISATITGTDDDEKDRHPGSKESYMHTLQFTGFAVVICLIAVAVIWIAVRWKRQIETDGPVLI